jgi:uncharacterized membrane protein
VIAGIDRDRNPVEFGRLLNLSDGMFAIAMTILVLSLVVPAGLSSDEFPEALAAVVIRVPIMALSIAIVFSAWIAHHRLFGMLQRADGVLIGLNVLLLGLVALTPFPHQVLGDYPGEPLAYVLYAVVLASVNVVFALMDLWVHRHGLLRVQLSEAEHRREVASGLVMAVGFAASIPAAFILVELTPLIWVALLPLNRLVTRQVEARTRPDGMTPGG